MAIFKCKVCAGSIEVNENQTTATCSYCGVEQTLPKLNDELIFNLYDRANHFRRNNEFDKAEKIYEKIILEDYSDSEAYWSLLLCKYGIEYVEDNKTGKRIPTINRTQYVSIFDDANYKKAIEFADNYQKEIYQRDAKTINEIQRKIITISQKEEPYDIFISYKETDDYGKRTRDSVIANDLYHQLVKEGYKVFFSRITLEKKLGQEYEPYIFAALNSSKVMIVLGTKADYFNSVWIRNEWSRFLNIVKESKGTKILIPAYQDMDPYDLPEEFSHLQSQDMGKLGFMQDIIHGIKKIVKKEIKKENRVTSQHNEISGNISTLLRRVDLFLEDGDLDNADLYCERILDIDPENAEVYLRKLLIDYNLKTKSELRSLNETFYENSNYLRVLRFDPSNLGEELKKYNEEIETSKFEEIYLKAIKLKAEQSYLEAINLFGSISNYKDSLILSKESQKLMEEKRVSDIYNSGNNLFESATTEEDYLKAASLFSQILEFRDSDYKHKESLRLAEKVRKEQLYSEAENLIKSNTISSLNVALKKLKAIQGYKDADHKIDECKATIKSIQIKEKELKRQKTIKMVSIFSPIIIVIIVLIVLTNMVFIPASKLKNAINLMENGNFNAAKEILEHLDYSNSKDYYKVTLANDSLLDGDYEQAELLIYEIGGEVIYSYDYNGGKTLFVSRDVIKQPIPQRTGYSFSHWEVDTFDFKVKNKITLNIKLKSIYIANNDTNYQVNYYLENVNDSNYTLVETIDFEGTSDSNVKAPLKEFEDYITPSYQHITIKSDGSSIVNYYYERIKYTFYEINYYLENIYDDEYTFEEVVNGKVSSTSNLNAPLKNFNGFVTPSSQKISLNPDGSSTVNYYYKRIRVNIDFVTNGGDFIPSKIMKYGEEINIVGSRDSFTFGGWFSNEKLTNTVITVGNQNITLYAYWNEEVKPSEFSYEIINNKVKIKKYNGNNSNVIIPTKIGGKSVYSIDSYAFQNKTTIIDLLVPDSVEEIGLGAFKGANNIVNITLPFVGKSRTVYSDIKAGSYSSPGLFGFIFGSGLENPVNNKENFVYQGQSYTYPDGYRHYYIPSSIKNITITDQGGISANAFYNMKNVETIKLPNNLKYIYSHAFYNLTNVQSYQLPENIEILSSYAFYNNQSLKEINLPNKITSIEQYAFYNTDLSNISLPINLKTIGSHAFYNNDRITNLTLPKGLETIGSYAFVNISITDLIVPDSVEEIGLGAFKGANNIVNITLPFVGKSRTVYSDIGAGSYSSPGLFGFIFGSGLENPVNNKENFVYQGQSYTYPDGYRHYYIPSSIKNITITDQGGISANAFYNMKNVETIKLPSKLEYIYTNAFYGNSKVTIYIAVETPIINTSSWNPLNRPIIYYS